MKLRGLTILALLAAALFISMGMTAGDAQAGSYEYPFLYKSPRLMGMGGANVAIGGHYDSVFANPAGLGLMKQDNWEVTLLNVSVGAGENAQDFVTDVQDAFDVSDEDNDGDDEDDQINAVNDVMEAYQGEHMHVDVNDLMSAARNSSQWGYGVGVFGGAELNLIPHQGLGSEGVLEVRAYGQLGGIATLTYNAQNGLVMGGSIKAVNRESITHNFSTREIVEHEDNIEDYITDELRETNTAFSGDLGVIYSFMQNTPARPSVGVSVLNIGDMDFGTEGDVPMSVNIGVAMRPKLGEFEGLSVGLDYVDAFNGLDQDEDIVKRLRIGGELELYDGTFAGLTVRAGLYQGYPSFGADIRLAILKLTYAYYTEEVGAYGGQDEDERQVLAASITW